MKENEYQCAYCGGIYERARTDEEAWEEHDRNFPGEPHETAAVICDDCYQEMVATTPPPGMKKQGVLVKLKKIKRWFWLWRIFHPRQMKAIITWKQELEKLVNEEFDKIMYGSKKVKNQ